MKDIEIKKRIEHLKLKIDIITKGIIYGMTSDDIRFTEKGVTEECFRARQLMDELQKFEEELILRG